MKAKRILVAGLALATVVGTNAAIYSPTFAAKDVSAEVTKSSVNITYGEEGEFYFGLKVKNDKKEDIKITECKSSQNYFVGELVEDTVKSGKENTVCKFTFKAKEGGDSYDVGKYTSDFSASFKNSEKPKKEDDKAKPGEVVEAKGASVEIVQKVVAVPKEVKTPLVYNGDEQAILSSADITSGVIGVKGDIAATNAGKYEYTLSLTDTKNYKWENSPKVDKKGKVNGKWNITRAALNLELTMADWVYGDEASEPVLTGNEGEGEVTYSYYAGWSKLEGVPTEAGKYSVCAEVAETDNYKDGKDCTRFEITKREVTVSIFGNTATFVYDGLKKSVSGYTSEISDSLYSSEYFFASGVAFEPLTAVEVGVYTDDLSEEHFFNTNRNFDVDFVVTPHVLVIEEPAVVVPTKTTSVSAPETGVFTTVENTADNSNASATVVMSVIAVITACGIAVAYRARR